MRENSRYHEAENHTGQDNSHTLVIEGRNAVLEAFRSGKPIDRVFVLDGCQDGPVRTIVREAKKHDALLNFVTKERLSQISETFFQAEDGIRDLIVTGVQTCALPIYLTDWSWRDGRGPHP